MKTKRSLKDAAADSLVKKPARRPVPGKRPRPTEPPGPAAVRRATPITAPPAAVAESPPPAAEPTPRLEARPGRPPSLARLAVSILAGFVLGFFFGRYVKII
jgi:hypothetical protein